MSSYPVDQNPRQVKGAGQGIAVSVVNDGASTVYVDDSGAVSPSGSLPVDPGDIVQWEAGSDLWVCTGAGESGHVLIANTTGNVFRAGAIAAQLLDQGLPAAIASAISLEGVPSIDRGTILYQDLHRALTSGAGYASTMQDASRYQSIFVGFGESGSAAGIPTREITIAWFADPVGTFIIGQDSFYPTVLGGSALGAIPVRAPYFNVNYGSAVTVGASDVSITVGGSYRQINRPWLWIDNGITSTLTVTTFGDGTGNTAAGGSIPAGTTQSWYPFHYSGRGRITIRVGACATRSELRVIDLGGGGIIDTIDLPVAAAAGFYSTDIILPPKQLELRLINNNAGALSYVIDVQQEGVLP